MNRSYVSGWIISLTLTLLLGGIEPLPAQTYSSGSTGTLGAFNPTTNTTVTLPPDGVLNYTTVNIPAGVTVTFQRNAANTPVILLATGDVTIAGTISVNGSNGANPASTPALGGPGGFTGGLPGSTPTAGSGPGGGAASGNADYGAPASFVSLLPLFGGSGGGGGLVNAISSAGGGGGGGAIVIASSTRITIAGTGSVTANGGSGGFGVGGTAFNAGGGSGGAIRLVAPMVTGTGTLSANGGFGSGTGAAAGTGRIRIESFTVGFTGPALPLDVIPSTSFSTAPGPVTPAGNPGLINLPTLRITQVGGLTTPATPTGSYSTADVVLPGGTANPVQVTLAVTNTPFPSSFTVKVVPRSGSPSTVTASAVPGGTFASATYTANVTLPTGQVSLLNAFGTFTLPQLAGLFPPIDGEPVDHVLMAASYGEDSEAFLVTKSGKIARAGSVLQLGKPAASDRPAGMQ
ncbi:MAG: hypothetical protein AB1555_07175 [Nitrospirota bacterium]